MRTKLLLGTMLKPTIVGLGTGTLGLPDQNLSVVQYSSGPDWKNYMDFDLGVETVLAALDAGIRFIDTAPWYGRGRAEESVGMALRERPALRTEVIVATKIGHLRPGDDYDFSYDAAMRSFEGSQKRLGMERLSIIHLHDPMGQNKKRLMGRRGAFYAMEVLRASQMVRYLGVAANDPVVGAEYVETGKFSVAIAVGCWSLINQSARNDFIPNARVAGAGLIAATAVERGILATGFQKDLVYGERSFSPQLIAHVKKIKVLCGEFGIPLLAAALQWCVCEPRFACVIPGARTPEQARENAAAGEISIPEEFWNRLEPLIQSWDCVRN